jgi:hypothetical protein
MLRRRIVLAAMSLVLALPATAAAQSAGDNQYVDPLAGQQPQGQHHATQHTTPAPASAPSSSSSPGTSAAPAGSSSAAPATSGSAAAAPQSTSVPLAHTGFDAWIPAVAGVALLGCALLLRRSAKAPQR